MDTAWLLIFLPIAASTGWWLATMRNTHQDKASQDFNQSWLYGINQLLSFEDDEALTTFLKSMNQQPKSVELQMVLGNLCRRKGEYERASLIHQAIVNHPAHSDETHEQAQFELAQDYQAAGWLDRAESLYVGLLKSVPYQQVTANNLLRIYQQEKDWNKAIQTTIFLLDLGYGSDQLQEQLCHYYCERCETNITAGKFPKAQVFLKKAVDIDPRNPRVNILQGRMASFTGDHQLAISIWERLKINSPTFLGLALPHIRDSFGFVNNKNAFLAFLKDAVKSSQDPKIISALFEALKTDKSPKDNRFLIRYLKDKPSIAGLKQVLLDWSNSHNQTSRKELLILVESLLQLVDGGNRFQCGSCGFKAESFEWSCSACHKWGTYRQIALSLADQIPTPELLEPEQVSHDSKHAKTISPTKLVEQDK